jgi:hypothetical protein
MPLSIKGRGGKRGAMNTKEFIEKVSKAKEIQKLCKHEKGDWFYNGEKPKLFCKAGLGSFDPREHIWLPTLEQLWEMLNDRSLSVIYYFYEWIATENQKLNSWVNIDKQDIKDFLLHFVMYELYNKQWNPDKRVWEARNGS